MDDKTDFYAGGRLSATGRRLIQLRWWLLGGVACAVLAAPTLLDIPLPWLPLLAVLALLVGFNFAAMRRVAADGFGAAGLAGQLAVDLVGLAVLLFLTGGAANPLVSLMLLPVAVAALALPPRLVGGVALLAVTLYSLLMLFALPLPISDAGRATRLHLGGMWLTFVVSAALIAWFVTRMTASIRARDAQLAAAREQALRDAQVVALGQLAAGAAHELGTPLATMNILAGELAGDARLPGDAREDLELLRRQIAICKEIVGNLTQQAGVERAAATRGLPLDRWLDDLLARWRTLWPQASCILELESPAAAPLVAVEPAIEQAVTNLLNNAARVAPYGMRLRARWDGERLRVSVCDSGPGFAPDILHRCGAEPVAPQGEGAGIGLWLTRAAVERRGGSLHLENSVAGGVATIELPLQERRDAPAETGEQA